MKLYPIMMNLEGKRVVVIGGGSVAARKVSSLLESGAVPAVISPELRDGLKALSHEGKIDWLPERFEEASLDQYPDTVLIFGATDRRDVNLKIHKAAKDRKIPCNIADVPDLCTFIVPAVITQGELMIAVIPAVRLRRWRGGYGRTCNRVSVRNMPK